MGIYYKDGNPEQACVRERSVKKRTGAEHEAARAVHDCGLHRGIDVGVVSNEISLERICGKIAVPCFKSLSHSVLRW